MRRYWKGDEGQLSDLAYRLTGSSDLYQNDGRKPYASINFVVAHDGFTLNDLVSYNEKHNEANGENNQDGANDNHSWNMGAEGPTDDPEINRAREVQMRNLLATLFLSQGVPMLCGGDEIGRTQSGNNNAYCQDNEISWYDWDLDERQQRLLEVTRHLTIALRRAHPNLRRRKFFQDREVRHSSLKDIAWYGDNGEEIRTTNGMLVGCAALPSCTTATLSEQVDDMGQPVTDDSFLILLNSPTLRELHSAAVAAGAWLDLDHGHPRPGAAVQEREGGGDDGRAGTSGCAVDGRRDGGTGKPAPTHLDSRHRTGTEPLRVRRIRARIATRHSGT